jgi:hypothetical protein
LITLLNRVPKAFAFVAVFASLCQAMPAAAAVIFTDNFDTGNTAGPQNGASWQAPTSTVSVSNAVSSSPSYSLQFTYAGVASGEDGMAQATMTLPQRSQYWFQYKLYIPANYYHRTDTGPNNNKFLAVYAAPYQTPGFQINLSTEPDGSGGSNLEIHYYNNGHEQSPIPVTTSFISNADKGKWMQLLVQVKVPSSSGSNDGIVNVWKNGQQVANVTNLASWGSTSNYISEAYFLGWADSGFTNTTLLYIDDLTVADTPLSSSQPIPDPPSNVTAR